MTLGEAVVSKNTNAPRGIFGVLPNTQLVSILKAILNANPTQAIGVVRSYLLCECDRKDVMILLS